MRVLHVAAGNLYGGVERILEEIALRAPDHAFALAFSGRLAAALDAAGAVRHDLGAARFSRPWTIWRARRRLARLLAETGCNRVIAHAPWAFALAAPVARGARRMLWAHDAMDGRHWTEQRVLRQPPDLVICNSRYTAAALDGWLPSRREVLYPPVSPAGPVASRAELRRALGAADEEVVILIASRLERWKGHQALIDAVAALQGPWRLWIAGAPQRPHEATYLRELEALVLRKGLTSRVTWLGSRTDMPRIFAASDIHCQPNTAPEPFGLVFVEALYAGLPVVTIGFGGAREIVTDACGLLLPPADPAALVQGLQRLVSNRVERTRLGAAGPDRAAALCDPDRQIASLERLVA